MRNRIGLLIVAIMVVGLCSLRGEDSGILPAHAAQGGGSLTLERKDRYRCIERLRCSTFVHEYRNEREDIPMMWDMDTVLIG